MYIFLHCGPVQPEYKEVVNGKHPFLRIPSCAITHATLASTGPGIG